MTWVNRRPLYCRRNHERPGIFATDASEGAAHYTRMRHSDQEDVSAQQSQAQAAAWLSRPHEDESRPGNPEGASRQGPDPTVGLI